WVGATQDIDAEAQADALLVHQFELPALGIEDERGVVGRAVVWPRARRAVVGAAGDHRGGVGGIDGYSAGRIEGEVEAFARSRGARAFEHIELLMRGVGAVADAVLAGPDAGDAERGKQCIVEAGGLRQVADADRDVAQHQLSRTSTTPWSALMPPA